VLEASPKLCSHLPLAGLTEAIPTGVEWAAAATRAVGLGYWLAQP
jgi:hypothetical protein